MKDQMKAIGYTRVSTEEQARDGEGLEKQRARISEEASRRGLEMVGIYEDRASGVGPRNAEKRADLQAALGDAKSRGVPLIVSRLDRLTREPDVLEGILQLDGVRVISCVPKEMANKTAIRQAAELARKTAKNISDGTKYAHAQRKARGEISGHAASLDEARKQSTIARQAKSSAVADRIAIHLDLNPQLKSRPVREIAEALNDALILSGHDRHWSATSVRRALKKALERLTEWNPPADEVVVTGPSSPATPVVPEADLLEARRAADPNWGRF